MDQEKEKIRLEKERIRKEKERIEWEKKEAEMKWLEEEKAAKGALEVYKKREVVEKPPWLVLMSNGQYAEVPHIDFEPKGIIAKRA